MELALAKAAGTLSASGGVLSEKCHLAAVGVPSALEELGVPVAWGMEEGSGLKSNDLEDSGSSFRSCGHSQWKYSDPKVPQRAPKDVWWGWQRCGYPLSSSQAGMEELVARLLCTVFRRHHRRHESQRLLRCDYAGRGKSQPCHGTDCLPSLISLTSESSMEMC
jgi:hypothetical protein